MNSIAARMVFQNAINSMVKAFSGTPGFDIRQYKLTQSYLRLEQPLTVGKSNYLFPVMINQSNPQIFNTEQRLNLQDSFVTSEVRFYLAQPSSGVDYSFRKLMYPNPFVFVDEPTALAVGAVYNGYMTISVNNNILVTAWDLDRHYYSPETQQTAPFGAGSPLTEYNGNNDGLYPMEPNVVFVGSKNNVVQIQLAQGVTVAPANARIGLEFKGILAQNSTVVS
jgi:hypothetical protein